MTLLVEHHAKQHDRAHETQRQQHLQTQSVCKREVEGRRRVPRRFLRWFRDAGQHEHGKQPHVMPADGPRAVQARDAGNLHAVVVCRRSLRLRGILFSDRGGAPQKPEVHTDLKQLHERQERKRDAQPEEKGAARLRAAENVSAAGAGVAGLDDVVVGGVVAELLCDKVVHGCSGPPCARLSTSRGPLAGEQVRILADFVLILVIERDLHEVLGSRARCLLEVHLGRSIT
mmetsp:Transcript_16662/g.41241  ORF Transcript_16662/g.41241 Transcript_16662/m.41241 type:complete len:230 (-) Transcript_16662:521-1210(-)